VREADNVTAICEAIVYKMWEPRHLTTLRASLAYYRDIFICLLSILHEQKYRYGIYLQTYKLQREVNVLNCY
jgi:hypothetical protein